MSSSKKIHTNIITSMVKKLEKYNAKSNTISAFRKESQKIIDSNYKIIDRLKQLNNTIGEKSTITTSRKQIITEKVVSKHSKNLISLSSFQDAKPTMAKVARSLSKFKKDVKFSNLPIIVPYKKDKNIVEFHIKRKLTKVEIEQLGNKISQQFFKDGQTGSMSIAIKYNKGWRSGYFTDFGEEVELYNPDMYDTNHKHYTDHQESFNECVIYLTEAPRINKPTEVGESDHNDCLYNCLYKVLYNNMPWKSAHSFKKTLGLRRDDKVDLKKYLPIIEKSLSNTAINCTGDYIYTSTNKATKLINLKLINEHVELNIPKTYRKIGNFSMSYKERKPIIYDPNTFISYDGKKEYRMTKEERNEHYNFETDYMLIVRRDNDNTFEQEYKSFIEDADELKRRTNGYINLYKTGYKDKTTALELFDRYTKHIANPPNIHQAEGQIISNATTAGIIFTDDYEGPAYKHDYVSQYPSIMNSKQLFPIGEGEFMNITRSEFKEMQGTFFKYGIYHVLIKCDPSKKKLFRTIKSNWYTHIDLTRAKELNLTMKLSTSDQPNFLYYSREKLLAGTELFKNYVDFVFPLKQNKVNRAKKILNVLWGGLCQRKYKKANINNTSKEFYTIANDNELDSIKPFDDNTTHIETYSNDNRFKTGFARIGAFLTSKGRSIISKTMEEHIDSIIRCHTDGFISKIPIDFKYGCNLGDIRYEGYNEHYYKINNSYNKDFI